MGILKRRLTKKQRERLLDAFQYAIENCDKATFERAIRDAGLQPDTLEYAWALTKWNESWKRDK